MEYYFLRVMNFKMAKCFLSLDKEKFYSNKNRQDS